MAKRFTDTGIWFEDWFLELSIKNKLFWYFVTASCNEIGIWKKNTKLLNYILGKSFDLDKAIADLDGRIIKIDGNKYLIPDFIQFQYGYLSLKSRVHRVFINKIENAGLLKYFEDLIVEESPNTAIKRKRLTVFKKEEIYLRDEFRCQYCGNQFEKLLLTIDHAIPITKGGNNEDDNLLTACITCNSKKSDKDFIKFIDENELKRKMSNRALKIYNRLSKKQDRLSNKLDSIKDKDKDKEKDKR